MESLLAGACVVAVYALTRSGNHGETEDSVSFAVRVRDDPTADLLQGTHLVYLPIGRAFAHLLAAVGLTEDRLLALQLLDTLLAGAAVAALWLLLRYAGCSRLAAAGGCGILAFSYGFWRNAIDVEVYALSSLTLVCALAAAWVAATKPSTRAFAVLGVAYGVAVLAHVTNVLFAAVVGLAVVIATRSYRPRRATLLRWGAAYAGGTASVVVPACVITAAVVGLNSPAEFWRWFTERSGPAGEFGTHELSNLPEGMVGSARALVGGHFAFALEPIREFLADRFAGKTFTEEQFFLQGFPDAGAAALIALAVAGAVFVFASALPWLRRRALAFERRVLAILAAAWLVPYTVIMLWWDPLNIELWSPLWLALAVVIAVRLDSLDRAERLTLVVGAVALLFVVNLVGSVLPQRSESRDYWRAKASWYEQHTRDDDLVVSNGYVWTSYLRYLLEAEVVDIEDLFREADTERQALAALRGEMASVHGRVLVSGESLDAFVDRPRACIDAPETCEFAAATSRELRDECELLAVSTDPHEHVWRCTQVSTG